MERPSVRQLECLVAVADTLSFRQAASRVGISQPALSEHVRAAERLLNVQVFERDRRVVLVTPAGEEVVGSARLALEAVDVVGETARRRGEPLVGPLRLGVIPTIAPYWLPALLPVIRERYPKLELILREDQTARLVTQLEAGQLDAALVALPVPGDFASAEIAHEHFVVAAPRNAPLLAKRNRLAETDLEDQTVLLLEDGHCLRDQALAVCERGGAVEAMQVRATSLPTLVPRRGAVSVAALGKPVPGRTIGLVWRMSSARLREFRLLAEAWRIEATRYVSGLRR